MKKIYRWLLFATAVMLGLSHVTTASAFMNYEEGRAYRDEIFQRIHNGEELGEVDGLEDLTLSFLEANLQIGTGESSTITTIDGTFGLEEAFLKSTFVYDDYDTVHSYFEELNAATNSRTMTRQAAYSQNLDPDIFYLRDIDTGTWQIEDFQADSFIPNYYSLIFNVMAILVGAINQEFTVEFYDIQDKLYIFTTDPMVENLDLIGVNYGLNNSSNDYNSMVTQTIIRLDKETLLLDSIYINAFNEDEFIEIQTVFRRHNEVVVTNILDYIESEVVNNLAQ